MITVIWLMGSLIKLQNDFVTFTALITPVKVTENKGGGSLGLAHHAVCP